MRIFNKCIQAATAAMLVLAAALPSVSAQEPVVLDEIVAKVNSEVITLRDLEKELERLRAGLREEIQDPAAVEQEFKKQKRVLLKNIIQNKMLLQRAEELGMGANIEVQVSQTLEQMRKQSGIPDLQILDRYLRERGSSLQEYRQSLRQRLIIDTLLQQFVYSKITLLTREIESYYQENIDQFTERAEVELKEILLLTENRDKSQVRQKAEDVLARLKAGESFEELAKEFSEGPTAAQGGAIGSFKKGSMAASVENVVFELEKEEISGVIETDYGFQILKVVDKKPPREQPLEEVRDQIRNELYRKKAQPGLKEFLDELVRQSYIYVAPKYHDEFDLEGLSLHTAG